MTYQFFSFLFFLTLKGLAYTENFMCGTITRVVSSESGAETGMCDVTVAVQFVYGWSGKRGKCSSAW